VPSLAQKFVNKIWLERAWDEEQLSYRNLSRFELKFELKFKEISMGWNWRKFTRKSWNFGFQWNLARNRLASHYCQEKSISIKKGIRELNSTQNGKFDWFHDSLNPKLYFWIPLLDLGSS
jgi:hypothetical protein